MPYAPTTTPFLSKCRGALACAQNVTYTNIFCHDAGRSPEFNFTPEEKVRRKAEREEFSRRCRLVFERVCPELIKNHYNWFIVIEPDSEDYFLDSDEQAAINKARQKHPEEWLMAMRVNETGACGMI